MWVEILEYYYDKTDVNNDIFKLTEDVFIKYEGRPHYGKYISNYNFVRYSSLEKFTTIQSKYDPYGIYVNDFIHNLNSKIHQYSKL